MTGSKQFDLSKVEVIRALKYLWRGVVYSIITWLVVITTNLNVPPEYAFLLPLATAVLTNLWLTVRKYVSNTETV